MIKSIAIKSAFSCGGRALDYLKEMKCASVVIVRDAQMADGVLDMISQLHTSLRAKGVAVAEYANTEGRVTPQQLNSGLCLMMETRPDTVIAVGSQQAITTAKLMLILYEYPELAGNPFENMDTTGKSLNTRLVVISDSSEDAQGVNQVSTIKIDSHDFMQGLKGTM